MPRYDQKRGFTLIEILVSVGIIVLLAAGALLSFSKSRNAQNLSTSGQDVLSLLRLAQSKSLAGEDNTSWGVSFPAANPDQYILFRGTSFAASTFQETYTVARGIEIANVALAGGGRDVIFKRLTGETDQSGTFDIRTTTLSDVFSVTVASSGKVYRTGTVPPETGTRITDARHRSFVLGWSIKTSVTLQLTFSDPPNPDVSNPVTMASYFDAGQTKFDWSGATAVGGQNQTLRIHTTALSAGNTTLSIDRDCRTNTKKLVIAIDGKTIATYEADCTTITVGAFGGTMSEP